MFKQAYLALGLFAAVATLPQEAGAKDAGFTIDQEASVKDNFLVIQRMEPGLSLAIRGDIAATQVVDVIMISLPSVVPAEWERALAPDPARTVSVPSGDGQNFLFSLHPNVVRALVVRSDGMSAV